MGEYILTDILHNGRKDIRGKSVETVNSKYEGLKGCKCILSLKRLEQFKPFVFTIQNHPSYEWWTTSEVLEATIEDDKYLTIETANSIYKFEATNE